MKDRRWTGTAKATIALNVGAAWLVAAVLMSAGAGPARVRAASSSVPSPRLSTACPGSRCPYAPPTATERGIAADVLARMNLERAAPARAYTFGGARATLPLLAPASPAAEATAQAAAEWDASRTTVADYLGADPPGYRYVAGGNAAAAGDSAGIDDSIMHSYGHALDVLSAAPTQVAVGAACSASGTVFVSEQFFNVDASSAEQGQARLAAELAQNSVYAQSGGTVTTVTDAGGTGPARDYLPLQPIVAGYGAGDTERYATGADWTCRGARYRPGSGPGRALPGPAGAIASSADGGGYYLADMAGRIDVHGDATFHGDPTGVAGRGHGADHRRPRLLAGGGRRRGLCLRRPLRGCGLSDTGVALDGPGVAQVRRPASPTVGSALPGATLPVTPGRQRAAG